MESLVPYLLYKRRKNAIKKHYKHEAEEDEGETAAKSSLSSSGGELERSVREFGQVEASKGQFEVRLFVVVVVVEFFSMFSLVRACRVLNFKQNSRRSAHHSRRPNTSIVAIGYR